VVAMKIMVFSGVVVPCSLEKARHLRGTCLPPASAGFLHSPADGGSMFFQYARLSLNYTALQPTQPYLHIQYIIAFYFYSIKIQYKE
jgi:hypothetical protein